MLTNLLMFIVMFACVAMLYTDGLWSNAIRLVNVVTAALLAMTFFEPLADWLEQWQPSYEYFWDFISLWGLFIIFSIIFRQITDRISQVQVKFLKIADRIGSGILSVWIGWIMVCFTMVSLHVAPLGKTPLFESFQPEERMVVGLAPDRQWLGFTQKMSQTTYARSASEAEVAAQKYIFDPQGIFLLKYATRRAEFESSVKKSGALRSAGG